MINIFKYINIPVFFISFLFGLFAVYLISDDKRIVYVYPTPENIDIIQYKDKAGTCFKYDSEEQECNENEEQYFHIKPQI
jgi:hypothetical protein